MKNCVLPFAPVNKLKDILSAGDAEQLAEFTRTELYPTIEPLSDKFPELIQLKLDLVKSDYEQSIKEKKVLDSINIAVLLIASVISIWRMQKAWRITAIRSCVSPMCRMKRRQRLRRR
ncbi:hypothetical protein FACS1894185_5050 [Betaproteobacteria bacterium]|nr:hypothetical protein FACS1894185_5050 [Betaproteobacteria bacterium]